MQVPSNARILVIHDAINFRNGIDGTTAIARLVLKQEPMDGCYFIFRNKMGHRLRVLYYHGSGFWLCTKRLSKGTFNVVWPKGDGQNAASPLLALQLHILLWGGDPLGCKFPKLWREVA